MYSSDVLVCLNDIPMCFNINPLCFSAHGQWSSGSEGQLSDSPSEWSVPITSCSALKRHGAWTISCTSRCDTNKTWSNVYQTVIFFTIYFFLYLLIILNIDENTTSLFIGFGGGDFIPVYWGTYVLYVLDRLSVHWN